MSFKFDRQIGKPGRKSWFFDKEDDFIPARRHVRKMAERVCSTLEKNTEIRSLLEVGPSHGLYEEAIPEFSTTIIREKCKELGVVYKTLDVDQQSSCDFHGSVEELEYVLNGQKFDAIVMLGVIEHVRKIWTLPTHLFRSLNPGGRLFINTPFMFKVHGPIPDCWRITEYGFRVLFEEFFEFEEIDTWPEGELGKNSFPLSINVVLKRR